MTMDGLTEFESRLLEKKEKEVLTLSDNELMKLYLKARDKAYDPDTEASEFDFSWAASLGFVLAERLHPQNPSWDFEDLYDNLDFLVDPHIKEDEE